MSISVLVADDQEMVRTGFGLILSHEADIEVVANASDGREAVALTRSRSPDVVLMDIRMPGLDGLAATKMLVSDPGVGSRIVILTTFDSDAYVSEALATGASGFLLKDAPASQLVHAIRVVAAGEAMLDPGVTSRLLADFARSRPDPADAAVVAGLTPRERDVLVLMADGLSNGEIAAELVLGESTVKTHVARILSKLGARDRAQAVIRAYRSGLASTRPDLRR
jgi:DNA-binding NarL/FixJ family response regulator